MISIESIYDITHFYFLFLKANNFVIQCSKLHPLRIEHLPSPYLGIFNVDALTN